MKDKIRTSFIISITFCLAVQMNGQDRNALVHLAPVATLLLGLISDYQHCSGFRVTKPSLPRKQRSVYVCTLCVQSENLWRIQSFERCQSFRHSCCHSFISVHVVICSVVHLGIILRLRVNCASLHWLYVISVYSYCFCVCCVHVHTIHDDCTFTLTVYLFQRPKRGLWECTESGRRRVCSDYKLGYFSQEHTGLLSGEYHLLPSLSLCRSLSLCLSLSRSFLSVKQCEYS